MFLVVVLKPVVERQPLARARGHAPSGEACGSGGSLLRINAPAIKIPGHALKWIRCASCDARFRTY